MLAAIVAVLSPLRDILSRDPLAAISSTRGIGRALAPGAGGRSRALRVLAAATALLLAAPRCGDPRHGAAGRGAAAGAAARAQRDARARQATRLA